MNNQQKAKQYLTAADDVLAVIINDAGDLDLGRRL